MKIAAVIVTFNVALKKFACCVSTYCEHVDYVIITDNSTDAFIKNNISAYAEDNNVIYISMQGNRGIANALNAGIEQALSLDCSWVLTMDQDSCFRTDLNGFKQYISNNEMTDVALIAPSYKINNRMVSGSGNTIELQKVIQSGCCLNMLVYKQIGHFREDYFIDYVDYEYCQRAIRNYKFRVLQISSEILEHEAGDKSVGRLLGWKYHYITSVPIRNYYQIRNGLDYIIMYHDYKQIIVLVKALFKVVLLSDKKFLRLKYMMYGVRDYLKGEFGEYHAGN